jgi:hypothetical protein
VPQTRERFRGVHARKRGARTAKKLGAAGPITIARDLKLIASRSSTLLKLLKGADGNTFKAWAAVPYPEAVAPEMATQQWLQLKESDPSVS